MTLYAALDVALEKTALCIVDHDGIVFWKPMWPAILMRWLTALHPIGSASPGSASKLVHSRNGSSVALSAGGSAPC